ncbi:MAG: hypothetical protein MUF54_09250, partial [Polyangiaceae bacterium]|nr:hypothetical protein [Polyangiaceae bacterium]
AGLTAASPTSSVSAVAPPLDSAVPPPSESAPSAVVQPQMPSAKPATTFPMPTVRPPVVERRERTVRIQATPQSALVSVDGDGPTAVSFGLERRLRTGQHSFAFSVAEGNPCCRPQSYTITIEPDGQDKPYIVHGILPFREARIALVGGPVDAKLDCPVVNVSIRTGAIASVPMTSPDRPVTCWVRGSGILTLEKRGNLQPGQTFVVTAPRP